VWHFRDNRGKRICAPSQASSSPFQAQPLD
jgi:hypothetical protein